MWGFLLGDSLRERWCNTLGDRIQEYTLEELIALYRYDGKSEDEAREMAESLFKELKALNNQTRNIWKRARHR